MKYQKEESISIGKYTVESYYAVVKPPDISIKYTLSSPEEGRFMATLIIIIFAISLVFFGVSMILFFQRKKEKIREVEERAASPLWDKLKEAEKRCGDISRIVEVINEHSGEYFYGLHDAGFQKLTAIQEELSRAIKLCSLILSDVGADTRVAGQILAFLLDPQQKPPKLPFSLRCRLDHLVRWEDTVHQLAMQCADALRESSQSARSLGVVRTPNRRKTIDTLDALKQLLEKEKGHPKSY